MLRIYADSYEAGGAPQPYPHLMGAVSNWGNLKHIHPHRGVRSLERAGQRNDSFGLASSMLAPHQGDPGHEFLYIPETQSALIRLIFPTSIRESISRNNPI